MSAWGFASNVACSRRGEFAPHLGEAAVSHPEFSALRHNAALSATTDCRTRKRFHILHPTRRFDTNMSAEADTQSHRPENEI